MPKFEDNNSPYLTFVETAAPSNPAAGAQRFYVDPADHKLKRKDSSGTIVIVDPATITSLATTFALTGDISPTQITADQNDYNPTGLSTATVLRLSSDASRTITGLQGGSDGRLLILMNVGANNIVLSDEDALSTAANRFALTANVTMTQDLSVLLIYDSTSSRWRTVGSGASGGGGGTTNNVLYTTGTAVTISNDATEQTVLSYSVPGGTLGSAHALRVTIQARIIHSVNGTLTVRLKYGATTLLTISVAQGSTVADKSSDIHFLVAATGATNAQRASGRIDMQDAANAILSKWNQEGTAAEDSTAAKTLAVTVQWGAASASLSYAQSWAGIELI